LSGDNIPAGSTVPVLISNLAGGDNSALVRKVVFGLGGIAALFLLALPFIRRRGAGLKGGREGGETEYIASERLARLEEIADLDDAFEAGEIPEDEYRAERSVLKAKLMNDPNPQA
jgi:hypothetical protein